MSEPYFIDQRGIVRLKVKEGWVRVWVGGLAHGCLYYRNGYTAVHADLECPRQTHRGEVA